MYQYNHTRPTPHLLFDVAKGNIHNEQGVNIFGFNRDVGLTYETIWNDSGAYVFPTLALPMSVVSSSALDTMPVLISGLDINYNPISATVVLNGLTPVVTAINFFRINSAVILSGSNVGNITISNGGIKYQFIGEGLGTTQACIYTVPAGHCLYIFRIDCNSATTNGQKYLYIRNVVTTNGRTIRASEATFATSQVSYDRQVPFKIVEKSDFQFECKSSSSTNEVAIFVEAVLVKDE